MISNNLYPIKFDPIYKTKMWGGSRISQLPNRSGVPRSCGESWDISGVEGCESVIANGFLAGNSLSEAIEVYMGDLVGESVYDRFGLDFPLLVKIIDAQDNLSVQVHPGDDMALEKHQSYGKTEMWYVIDCDPNSMIVNGFGRDVDRGEYLRAIEDGSFMDMLNRVSVSPGDVFYIPAGTVHTIGKGCMVAEIQQASDITYRIYDYNRVDAQGNMRQLHTEMAADALCYAKAAPAIKCRPDINQSQKAVDCSYFTANVMRISQPTEKDFPEIDSFIIYMCVQGGCSIVCDGCDPVQILRGDTVLIPACISGACFITDTDTTLLEVYIKGE
ncbi:MAG: class I mannose-6-phosphate isomerase [Bacteroidales bacterium]|nr:class I mannose-6-phosphate isomerase [Bacteroidales bacterium]